jgi:hypothetical protein
MPSSSLMSSQLQATDLELHLNPSVLKGYQMINDLHNYALAEKRGHIEEKLVQLDVQKAKNEGMQIRLRMLELKQARLELQHTRLKAGLRSEGGTDDETDDGSGSADESDDEAGYESADRIRRRKLMFDKAIANIPDRSAYGASALLAGAALLDGSAALLVGTAAPVGRSAAPVGGAAPPHGDPDAPLGGSAAPLGDPAAPVGGAAPPHGDPDAPLGGSAAPLGDPSAPVVDPAAPVGGSAAPVVDPAAPVGDRAALPDCPAEVSAVKRTSLRRAAPLPLACPGPPKKLKA